MVYKVSGDFTDENLQDFINKLKYQYKVMYHSGTLYLALKDYQNEVQNNETLDEINTRLSYQLRTKIFLPQEDFWVKTLTDLNTSTISYENNFVKGWIEENLVRLDRERLEVEKQKQLQQVWYGLDILEKEIEKSFMKLSNSQETSNTN